MSEMEDKFTTTSVFDSLTSHLKDRYKRLERRCLFLRERILQNEHLHRNMEHDKAELSSLEWAMRIILKYYGEHPKEEDWGKPDDSIAKEMFPVCQEEQKAVQDKYGTYRQYQGRSQGQQEGKNKGREA
jgi:hypothetical protein